MEKEFNRGITIIALVVTIIVLLILAGITIGAITGNNGLLGEGDKAKISAEVTQYQQKIDEIRSLAIVNEYNGNVDDFLDLLVKKIKNDTMFKKAKEVTPNYDEDSIKVVTKEGYIFKVTMEKTDYIGGDQEGGTETDINNVVITIKQDPNTWTNGVVKVSLTANATDVKIEYKINDGKWQEYNNKEIEIEDNGTKITARAKNSSNETGQEKEETIKTIDRLDPKTFLPTVTPGKNELKVVATTDDQEETDIDGKSGIKGYKFSNDNGLNWTDIQEKGTYTFEDLQAGVEYQIKVKVMDNAGNETEVGPVSGIPTAEAPAGTVRFSVEPEGWTKGPVKVTITAQSSNYDIEYSLNNGSYQKYNGPVEIYDNNTKILARLVNQGTAGEASEYIVDKIDKVGPKGFSPNVINETTTSITVEGNTDDSDADSTSGKSGIKEYWFSKDNGSSWEGPVSEGNYIFTGLAPDSSYQIKVKAVDNAGNETISSTYWANTTSLPNPSSCISFVKNPSDWTNTTVLVTINNAADSYYILQYRTSENNNWSTYFKGNPVTVTNNGTTVYARLKDPNSDYATSEVSTTINTIDRLAPWEFSPDFSNITENSIKVTASTSDRSATSTDGQSGIKQYRFGMSSNGGKTYSNWTSTTSNSYTFGNLSPGTTYTFKVEVTDNAGNITTSYESSTTTKVSIPDGEDYITFDYSPRDWTNGNVTITITSTAGSQYEIQYSLDGTYWYTYNSYSKPTRSSNGPVYARLKSGSNYGSTATGNVTKIDKSNPYGWTSYSTYGDYAIITVGTSDSGGSGVSTSYNTTTSNITKQSNTQYRVTANGTYYFIVYDNAGNSSTFSCTVSGIEDKELLVGDYVNYTPSGSSSISLTTDDLGVSQTIYREDLEYRVLEINGNYATLVSSGTDTQIQHSSMARLYNNMVYVLNNTAKTLYSNSSLGATARSIKQEDYEEKVEDGYTYYTDFSAVPGYNTYSTASNQYYPNTWPYEEGSNNKINGTYNNGSWKNSEQPYKISGETTYASSVTVKNNFYLTNNISSHMKGVKTRNSNNDTSFYYEVLCNDGSDFYYANRLIGIATSDLVIGYRHGGRGTNGIRYVRSTLSFSLTSGMKIIVENVPVNRINLNSGNGTQSSPWGIN